MYEAGKPVTVKQIADKLEEVSAKIHYHIKKMEKHNIVKLDYTKEIKGIVAKYYIPTAKYFDIRCSEDEEEVSRKLMLGETQRIISEIYDSSKDIFINQLQRSSKENQNNKSKGTITANDIYYKGTSRRTS